MDDQDIKPLRQSSPIDLQTNATKPPPASQSGKKTSRRSDESTSQKRRCVSTACTACRRRKSKCNGAVPSCAACASVYGTECIYDPSSDHRRKGVYRAKVDSTKASKSTLQTLIEAILNVSEDDVSDVVKKIRTCDSLDTLAEQISKQKTSVPEVEQSKEGEEGEERFTFDMPIEGERELACKMGELRLMNGSVRFIGGTSHLIYLDDPRDDAISNEPQSDTSLSNEDPVTSWTRVTQDKELITHLMNMYFNWHYTYFATLSKSLFYRDFLKGKHAVQHESTMYCSSLLVNAILTLGCHFTSIPGAYSTPGDSGTKGDHFFAEAKRLIVENDEFERPKITTVQALALLSIREAGCGREAKGWAYSGMAFRMAQDIGLNFDNNGITTDSQKLSEYIIDARRMTFWGCFLFDKTWSNYLGRLPQIPKNSYNMPKYEVFPTEDAEPWTSYTDTGFSSTPQPSRTRATGLQLLKLCEISSELLLFFYCPNHISRLTSKSLELKTLSELHQRLEAWRKDLPIELEPREGQLPNVILVHIFFHLQYIHLFRPFLRYSSATSPLPPNVSPRRICTANAGAISKLMRLYKKSWDLGQISSIAVYMIHSACTIHLLNLPEKTAKKDIIHGVKHLEEIAENWPCAKRTLSIISMLAQKWNVELPKEASAILQRTGEKYGHFNAPSVPSPQKQTVVPPSLSRRTVPSTTSKPENSTSFSERSQNQMNSQQDIPPSVNDLIMASASLAEISGISSPMEQPLASNGLNVDSESGSLDTSWLCPRLPQAVNDDQNYQQRQQRQQQRFVSMSDAQGLGLMPSGSTHLGVGVRQVAPSQLFQSLDQNWLLNHNTGWHQNNEAWNRPDSGMPTSDQIEEIQSDNIAMPQRPSRFETLHDAPLDVDNNPLFPDNQHPSSEAEEVISAKLPAEAAIFALTRHLAEVAVSIATLASLLVERGIITPVTDTTSSDPYKPGQSGEPPSSVNLRPMQRPWFSSWLGYKPPEQAKTTSAIAGNVNALLAIRNGTVIPVICFIGQAAAGFGSGRVLSVDVLRDLDNLDRVGPAGWETTEASVQAPASPVMDSETATMVELKHVVHTIDPRLEAEFLSKAAELMRGLMKARPVARMAMQIKPPNPEGSTKTPRKADPLRPQNDREAAFLDGLRGGGMLTQPRGLFDMFQGFREAVQDAPEDDNARDVEG